MSKKAEALATSINLSHYLRPLPDDWLEKVQEGGFKAPGYLIYRRNGKMDKKHHRRRLTAKCTACGKRFRLPFTVENNGYKRPVEDVRTGECPKCGASVRYIDWAAAKWGIADDKAGYLYVHRVDDCIVAQGYRLDWAAKRDGIVKYTNRPTDVYIFGLETPLRFSNWYTWGLYGREDTERWEYRADVTDTWRMAKSLIYPFDATLFEGTCLENCKAITYVTATHDARYIKFWQQYLLYPGIENLVVHGLYRLVEEKLTGSQYVSKAINWRKCKPTEMLGLNRAEMKKAKEKWWDSADLVFYKFTRDRDLKLSEKELQHIRGLGIPAIMAGAKRCGVSDVRYIRYLFKQLAIDTQHHMAHYFDHLHKDYIGMAQKLEYDLRQERVVMPKDLRKAHDDAVDAVKFEESEALRVLFEEIYNRLAGLTWQDGDFFIRPAKSEAELIAEGQKLSHCVGRYGQSHVEGECIFFIRNISEPDTPYYTLQLNTKKPGIINNLGYRNKSATVAVQEFAQKWMAEIVKNYDFKKGRLKKATNKKKAA